MSSIQCLICHNPVNSITNGDVREKYREVNGIKLCPESHLCHICCHMVNKLWMFKNLCFKRSLAYPLLFSDQGGINLQRTYTDFHILCSKETYNCETQLNCTSQHIISYDNDYETFNNTDSRYVELRNEKSNIDEFCNVTEVQDEFKNADLQYCIGDVKSEYYNTYNITEHKGYESSTADETADHIYEDLLKENIDTDDVDVTEKSNAEIEQKKSKKQKRCGFIDKLLTIEEQKVGLELKRKEKKYIDAEFKCYNCALGFLFKDTYQTHMMRHEESNGEYKCDVCTLRFASHSVLRAHRAVHARGPSAGQTKTLTEENTPCHLCGRVFKDSSGLQQHLKRFHLSKTSNRNYSCNVCGKVCNNQAAVRTHLIKHINRKFSCERCPSTFSSPYTLNQHKKRHEVTSQEEQEQQHRCDICNLAYTSRKSLLAHKRNALVHQDTVFKCPVCNRVCPNQRALSSHIATVHSTSKDHSCHMCRAQYTSKKSLMRHVANHTKPQNRDVHACHMCPSIFKSKSKLNRHLREVCKADKLDEDIFS